MKPSRILRRAIKIADQGRTTRLAVITAVMLAFSMGLGVGCAQVVSQGLANAAPAGAAAGLVL